MGLIYLLVESLLITPFKWYPSLGTLKLEAGMCRSKKCFKCGEVKSLSEFYRHKMMADGHLNKCKQCTKEDSRKNRKTKIDYYRAYDRERGSRQNAGYLRKYRDEFPIKYAAHLMVGNAVASGRLVRPHNCENCLEESNVIHGHHDDYAQPLVVRWLCVVCHKAWHDENGEGLNGR